MDMPLHYNSFIQNYNTEEKDAIWKQQSQIFKDFWNNRVLNHAISELNDEEIDDIVRILDKKGKGNTKQSEAIAIAMIAQGAWRRMFNEIHATKEMASVINQIFVEQAPDSKAKHIDRLYELNKERKNNLTGQSANAINCLLAAYDPFQNLSMISLNDRIKILQYFNLKIQDWNELSIGQRVVQSNTVIINYFKDKGINDSVRTISVFLYSTEFKDVWKEPGQEHSGEAEEQIIIDQQESITTTVSEASYIFGLEKHLEEFLIENWEKTELGKKYELNEEDGELASQQYKTDIGFIDILAKEKETGDYVVIELKKNQTSDETIGQLYRYMGWVKEKRSNGKPVKGIIIAGKYDDKLHYASKMTNNVEIFIYKVDFKLESHEKNN